MLLFLLLPYREGTRSSPESMQIMTKAENISRTAIVGRATKHTRTTGIAEQSAIPRHTLLKETVLVSNRSDRK